MTALGQALHYVFYLFFRPHPRTGRFPYLKLAALEGTWKGLWWGAVDTDKGPARHGFSGRHTPPQPVDWQFDGQAGVVFASGIKILRTFFENFDSVRHDGRRRWIERRFQMRWHGLTLSGIFDRLDIEDDSAVIVDYKSKHYPDYLLETGIQMTMYQLAYESLIRGSLPGQPPLKAIRIYDYRSGTYQDAPLRSAYEFGKLLRYLTETSMYLRGVYTGRLPTPEQMLEFDLYDPLDMIRGDTTPNHHIRGEHCNYCPFLKQCRQWERRELPTARLRLHQERHLEDAARSPNQLRLPLNEHLLVQIGSQSTETLWQQSRLITIQERLAI